MSHLTSNQYYGGINRRFERRAALLKRFGFTFKALDVGGEGGRKTATVGVWLRARFGSIYVLPSSVLSLADNRVWIDELSRVLKCGRCYRLPL